MAAIGRVLLLAALLVPTVTLHGQQASEESFDRGDFLVRIEGPRVITRAPEEIVLQGVANAGAGSLVKVTIGVRTEEASVDRLGRWEITWPEELAIGVYEVGVEVLEGDRIGRARKTLVLREGGRIPIRPLIAAPPEYGRPDPLPGEDDITTYTDRWRITPPPYELTVEGSRWDPYNQNKLKGDFPIIGDDKFLVLTATSDTFIDAFSIPVPSSVSPDRPDSNSFFGQPSVLASQQNFIFTADFYEGDTAFKPFNWRVRASAFSNLNYLQAEENQVVKPDVSRGTDRFTGLFTLQELFFEKKLADLSPNYDFVSVRVGIQPFNSDFRGFVFNDINLAVRFFGSTKSNRNQFNLYLSDRLEKDTNSQLNRFELREQQVAIANFYRQDLFVEGYNGQWSIHYFKDEPSFFFDRNGVLARPDPIGEAVPHEIEGVYLGWTGFGHFGRLNIDHALYWALGEDSLNPIAGRDPVTGEEKSDISAFLAAIELSFDKDWGKCSMLD